MRVLVTGATGWIGSATVAELLAHGHDVLGLVRSEESSNVLRAKGVTPWLGGLDDLGSLAAGASQVDGVIHLANKHDWANPAESNRAERAAVEALAESLEGSDRPLVIASALSGLDLGRPATESDVSPFVGADSMRGGSENLALSYAERGVRAVATRFAPTVHAVGDQGFMAQIVAAARTTGVSAYVGDGSGAWSAVHRDDVATLLRLALEQAPPGTRLHATGEEAVTHRRIAEAIGQRLDLVVTSVAPEKALEHFGFVGRFFGARMTGSSRITRDLVGWKPVGPTILEDIAAGAYD